MAKRVGFIDIAKCFAIAFIVLGHTLVHSEHCNYIYKFLCSFHVVLFFVLSGYTFYVSKGDKASKFIYKKFCRIMIPYFIWAILFLVPYMLLGKSVDASIGTNASFDLGTQLLNVFYGNGNGAALKQNSALWFLPALFSMEIIYYFVIKFIENKNSKVLNYLLLLFLLMLGYCSQAFFPFVLPWGIKTAIELGMFFYIGYMLKKFKIFKVNKFYRGFVFVLILLGIGIFTCYLNPVSVSCMEYSYGNYLLAIFSGLSLSLVEISVSFWINKNRLLEYVGRNTMGILIFHKLVILIFQTKLGFISELLLDSSLIIELTLSVIITILSIFISLLITKCVKKLLPLALGE